MKPIILFDFDIIGNRDLNEKRAHKYRMMQFLFAKLQQLSQQLQVLILVLFTRQKKYQKIICKNPFDVIA